LLEVFDEMFRARIDQQPALAVVIPHFAFTQLINAIVPYEAAGARR
jgi:hypothetical protein